MRHIGYYLIHVYNVLCKLYEFNVFLSVNFLGKSFKQVDQLSQRDRAAGWFRFGQKWKTGTGRQYFAVIMGLSSITVT